MKFLTIGLLFAFSSGAFAISDSKLIKKCELTGATKLQMMAKAQACTIVIGTLKVEAIDNRRFNPSKYVWYSFLANCPNEKVTKLQTLVQYDSFSRKCL